MLGRYDAEHTHPIGTANARFTHLPLATHTRIAELLPCKVDSDHIVRASFAHNLGKLIQLTAQNVARGSSIGWGSCA